MDFTVSSVTVNDNMDIQARADSVNATREPVLLSPDLPRIVTYICQKVIFQYTLIKSPYGQIFGESE